MTETEKKAEIRKLQEEINRRCCFFTVLSDIRGNNTGLTRKIKMNPKTQNNGIPRKG